MKEREKADMLEWIRGWEKAGAVMEQTRRHELDHVDVQHAIESLDDAFESALLHSPVRPASGLIELQAWFARARQ